MLTCRVQIWRAVRTALSLAWKRMRRKNHVSALFVLRHSFSRPCFAPFHVLSLSLPGTHHISNLSSTSAHLVLYDEGFVCKSASCSVSDPFGRCMRLRCLCEKKPPADRSVDTREGGKQGERKAWAGHGRWCTVIGRGGGGFFAFGSSFPRPKKKPG
ncbi:hypothetical protein EDD21DRAFT_393906 [Dissophora ornata]|nr:hypothetical protein EDD21DRAFT_393906 [Dissophora ornata]